MFKTCYLCGRTEEQFKQYYNGGILFELGTEAEILREGERIHKELEFYRENNLHCPIRLSEKERLMYRHYQAELYKEKIRKLEEEIEKIRADPLYLRPYLNPCTYDHNLENFCKFCGKYDDAFVEKYIDWTSDKYKSALACDYPFESESDKELLGEMFKYYSSLRTLFEYPDEIIEGIDNEIQSYKDMADSFLCSARFPNSRKTHCPEPR